MTVPTYDALLKEMKTSDQDRRQESLRYQRGFLEAVSHHHRLWAKHSDNLEAAQLHLETIVLLQKAIDNYDRLLDIKDQGHI